jgi:phosphoglycerate dehydrogenase-like enzyme
MQIVFHGENAASFSDGFDRLLDIPSEIVLLPDRLSEADRRVYEQADVIIGVKFDASLPEPKRLGLFHVPGAGYDAVNLDLLPRSAVICNCFGHEQAIAEYVMGAILARHLPLADADAKLRRGEWTYWAGAAARAHDELAEKTIGLLGYGHIGKAIARRAKAFDMRVSVANRSAVQPSETVDEAFTLDQLGEFWGSADFIVTSLPLTEETAGIVGSEAFAAMRSDAVLINVGRGPTVDQRALYDALKTERIAGAIIDTWYAYPTPDSLRASPAELPFHELSNIVMTPHMSGWTGGTIRRRQHTMASNIMRRHSGEACINVVREALA